MSRDPIDRSNTYDRHMLDDHDAGRRRLSQEPGGYAHRRGGASFEGASGSSGATAGAEPRDYFDYDSMTPEELDRRLRFLDARRQELLAKGGDNSLDLLLLDNEKAGVLLHISVSNLVNRP